MERPFKYSESDRELENVINKYLKPSSFSASIHESTNVTRESSSIPLSNLTNQYISHQNGKILPNSHEQTPKYERSLENYQQMNFSPTRNNYNSNIRLENDQLKNSANTALPINQNSFILTSPSSGFKSSKYENQDLVKAKYESDLAICNFWRKFNSTEATLENSKKEPLSFFNFNSNTPPTSDRTKENHQKEKKGFQTPKTKKEENTLQNKKVSMIPFENRSRENFVHSVEKPETNLETFGQAENFFSPKSGDTGHDDIIEERLSFSNRDYIKTSDRGEYMFQKDTIARDLDEHKTKNAPKNRPSQKIETIVGKNAKNSPKQNRRGFGRRLIFLFILALGALFISYAWGHAWKFYN